MASYATATGSASFDSRAEDGDSNSEFCRRGRRLTSDVWQHFHRVTVEEEVDGKITDKLKAVCKICEKRFNGESSLGTTHLKNHYNTHSKVGGRKQSELYEVGQRSVDAFQYDEAASKKKLSMAIIMHQCPFNVSEQDHLVDFISSLHPSFPIRSHSTIKEQVMRICEEEKNQVCSLFMSLPCRLSATAELCTSNTQLFLRIAVHFIDENWNRQERTINMISLDDWQRGVDLCSAFLDNMIDWKIGNKMFSLTLDTKSSRHLCITEVISRLNDLNSLVCGGKFFHVICATHIINLAAQDCLTLAKKAVGKIREIVRSVQSYCWLSEAFDKQAIECGLDISKPLSLDVNDQWDCTYSMVRDAIYFRSAFEKLASRNPVSNGNWYEFQEHPSSEEWDEAKVLVKCLRSLHKIFHLLQTGTYPTASLFQEFCGFQIQIARWCNKENDPLLVTMAASVKEKLDKYGQQCKFILAMASFLDPRFKAKMVEYYFSDPIYGCNGKEELERLLRLVKELYNCYELKEVHSFLSDVQENFGSSTSKGKKENFGLCSEDVACTDDTDLDDSDGENRKRKFNKFLLDISQEQLSKTDLDRYMDEALLPRLDGNFDLLSWWKTEGTKYPILAKVAREVLAVPVSSISPKSTISSRSHIDIAYPYCSKLDAKVLEALVCTRDWIKFSMKDADGEHTSKTVQHDTPAARSKRVIQPKQKCQFTRVGHHSTLGTGGRLHDITEEAPRASRVHGKKDKLDFFGEMQLNLPSMKTPECSVPDSIVSDEQLANGYNASTPLNSKQTPQVAVRDANSAMSMNSNRDSNSLCCDFRNDNDTATATSAFDTGYSAEHTPGGTATLDEYTMFFEDIIGPHDSLWNI